MLMEILFGILVVILGLISIVVIRNKQQISAAVNTTLALRKAQKDLEKAAYNEAMEELLPEFAKAKALKDIEKKLNKKPLAEKLSDMSKELTKDVSSGGREAKGLNSIMDDMNVFNQKIPGRDVDWRSQKWDSIANPGDYFHTTNPKKTRSQRGRNQQRKRQQKEQRDQAQKSQIDFLGMGEFKKKRRDNGFI